MSDMPHAYWRLFRSGENPRTLYHAHHGTTSLELNQWHTAVRRIGANPGKKNAGTRRFRTGWHVFAELKDLLKYSRHMNPEYMVCHVWCKGKIRPKPGSRSTVLLADRMYVPHLAWTTARKLRDYEESSIRAPHESLLVPSGAGRGSGVGASYFEGGGV